MKQMSHKNNNFIINIKETQNDTWQGSIQWIRCDLDIIILIDSALNDQAPYHKE